MTSRAAAARAALLTAALLIGCTLTLSTPTLPQPNPTPIVLESVDGWEALAPGLERRTLLPDPDNALTQIVALRIDPTLYQFRVHYQPGDPLSLQRWRDSLPGVVAFINANFFDAQSYALGLVVTEGKAYGQSFTDRGGIFQVEAGAPRVRSILAEPYYGEPLEQAAQAFPMLVLNGQAVYTNTADRDVSRRTVVAQDTSGRVLFLTTTLIGLTLADLSAYLPTTDLNLVTALNMDGGGSTMLYIGAGNSPFLLRSFDAVPAIIAVYSR